VLTDSPSKWRAPAAMPPVVGGGKLRRRGQTPHRHQAREALTPGAEPSVAPSPAPARGSTTCPQPAACPPLWWAVAGKKLFWVLCFSDMVMYMALKTLGDWTLLLLMEAPRRVPSHLALQVVFWMEMGCVVGNILSGVLSDVLGGRRCLTSALFAGLSLPAFLLFWALPTPDPDPALAAASGEGAAAGSSDSGMWWYVWWSACLLFVVGLGLNGPRTLTPVAMRERMPPVAAGTAAGVLGLVGQVGATLAGAPVGLLVERRGWDAALWLVAVCLALVAAAGFVAASLPDEQQVEQAPCNLKAECTKPTVKAKKVQ